MPSLIPSGRLSHGLVAGRQSRDGDEGEKEGPEAGDAPGAEDDAEVGCVPCEKHLHGILEWSWGGALVLVVVISYIHVAHHRISVAHVHISVVAVIHAFKIDDELL